jgi:hypothetical protein
MSSNSNKNTIWILAYWFINQKHNFELFYMLEKIKHRYQQAPIKIIGLNPFNSPEDIIQFKQQKGIGFELSYDHKHSAMFYQIHQFPSILIMENNGKILKRFNGFKEDMLQEIAHFLSKEYTINSDQKQIALSPYLFWHFKNNLLFRSN